MERVLDGLAALSVRRPWTLVLCASVPPLLCGLLLLRTPVDLSFTGILDRGNPEVYRYFEVSRRHGLGGNLLVLLEGPEADMPAAIRALEEGLGGLPGVRAVVPPLEPSWWSERAPWLVEPELFDQWLAAAGGSQVAELEALRQRLEGTGSQLAPVGARLVQVRLERDPLDERVGRWQYFGLERAAKDAVARAAPAMSVELSGLPAIAAQDQARTLGTVSRLTPVSLLVVLAIFAAVERRILGLAAVHWPMLLSMVATLGLIGVLTGGLTLMETFFGVTVFGLGIDFAVHLLVRLREERSRGASHAEALRATLRGTGRGVISGALTTAGAFLVAATAPDPVAVHLGLSGGIGLVLCLVLTLLLLPPLWTLLDRREERLAARSGGVVRSAPAHHRELAVPFVARLAGWAERRPALHLTGTAVVMLLLCTGLVRLRYETDLSQVFNRKVPALATVERIGELFGLNGAPWVSSAPDLDAARDLAARFRADPVFGQVVTVTDFLPAPVEAERRRDALAAVVPQLRQRLSTLEGLRGTTDETLATLARLAGIAIPKELSAREALDGATTGLSALVRAADSGPPVPGDLPDALRQRFAGADGEVLVLAYAQGNVLDGATARDQRRAAQAIDPDATSLSALLEAVMVAERPWLPWVAGGTIAFVGLVVWLDFRRPRLALLAFVPVLVGSFATLGVLGWVGVAFNPMTVIVLPLLVGLGVDEGIHVVHRIVEDGDRPYAASAAAVGRAIVMTTTTTLASFAVLLLTDHPGLESMAWVMLVGMTLSLLASITTLPALAVVVLGRRSGGADG